MRALVRRHRLAPGDRLVFSGPDGEAVTSPIVAIGEHTVVLSSGEILEWPPDKAAYIERRVDEEALVARAMADTGKIRAD